MRGWVRAVARELRHTTCLLAFATVAVLVGVLLWTKGASWGGRWNEIGYAIRDYMILLAPVSVVFGAWSGGQAARDDVGELVNSTRRSALARHSADVVALALATYAGVLVGLASAAWTIVLIGGYGTGAAPAYLLAAFPTVLAYVALGYGIGRVLRWRIVAPIGGVLTYLVLGFMLWGSDQRAVLAGGGWLGGTDAYLFDTDGWAWTTAMAFVAAVTLMAVASVERRPASGRAWIIVAAVGSMAAIAAAPSALAAIDSGPNLGETRAEPRPAMVCTTDTPTVCVQKADQHVLAQTAADARAVLDRLAEVDGAPRTARQSEIDGDSSHLVVWPTDTTPFGKPDTRYGATTSVATHELFRPAGCYTDLSHVEGRNGTDPYDEGFASAEILSMWATDGSIPDESTWDDWGDDAINSILQRFGASTEAQRRDYAGRIIAAGRTCDLDAARAAIDALADPS